MYSKAQIASVSARAEATMGKLYKSTIGQLTKRQGKKGRRQAQRAKGKERLRKET